MTEANSILAKDPDNLPARRLLARIYVRTLGDLSNTSGQHDTLVHASDQYREILRLDPTDTDAALWLARLYRLQNEQDKAETVLRALLAREPANENGVEQFTQLLLDEGKSQEAVSSLQGILQRAPTPQAVGFAGRRLQPDPRSAERRAGLPQGRRSSARRHQPPQGARANSPDARKNIPKRLNNTSACRRWMRTTRTTICASPKFTAS